jgi:hypothetical protein
MGIFPSPYSSNAVKNAWNSFAQGCGRKFLLILLTRSSRAEIRRCLWTISEGGTGDRQDERLWDVSFAAFVPFGDCSVDRSGGGGGGARHSGGATRTSPFADCVPRCAEATAVRRHIHLVRPRRVVTVAATVARLAIFAAAAVLVLFQLSQGAEHSQIAHRRGLPDKPNEERKSVAQDSPFDRQFRHFQSPPSEHRSHRQFLSFEVPRLANQRCFHAARHF